MQAGRDDLLLEGQCSFYDLLVLTQSGETDQDLVVKTGGGVFMSVYEQKKEEKMKKTPDIKDVIL